MAPGKSPNTWTSSWISTEMKDRLGAHNLHPEKLKWKDMSVRGHERTRDTRGEMQQYEEKSKEINGHEKKQKGHDRK